MARSLIHHTGVCCSSRQLQATAVLLLLACCCAQQIGPHTSSAAAGRHSAARLLTQQQAAIGDEDDFDWDSGPKDAAQQSAAQTKQQAGSSMKQQVAQSKPAESTPQAAPKKEPEQKVPQQASSSSSGQNPAQEQPEKATPSSKQPDSSKPTSAAAQQPAQQELSNEPVLAMLPDVPDADAAAAADKHAPTSDSQQEQQTSTHSHNTPGSVKASAADPNVITAATAAAQDAESDKDEPLAALPNDQDQGADSTPTSARLQPAGALAAAPLDDVDPAGVCKNWANRFCEDIEAGGGQLADCLAQHQAAADSGESRTAKLDPLSDECHEEVLQLKIWRSKSVESNPALAKACADDIHKFCNVTWFAGLSPGSVLACLKEARTTLKPACQKEVFKLQLDAAEDYRADEGLHKACQADADLLCSGIKPGGGQIQACLRKQRSKLTPDCAYELFRKEAQDAGDIRLSVRLFRACLPDKKQFCADVPPGQALASHCLEEHRESLSDACREEVDAMLERRVRDFRLDSRLKASCQATILELCSDLGDVAVMESYDTSVANCLQDFRDEINEDACQAQVRKYQELAAQDIRFNPRLADACVQDRMDLCAHVPLGSARVIRCLQNQRAKLSTECRSTLRSEEISFSESIDFNYPMKQACAREMEQFCKMVPHGGGRVIRCLQDNLKAKGFSKGCREEVQRYQQESAQDYRLNHRLYKSCKDDVSKVCADACDPDMGEVCGGRVLACLTGNQAKIKSSACRKEVTYLLRMGVQDFRTDMQLADACRPDVEQYCAAVEPGEGRVHKCLREHFDEISNACKREEVRLEAQESDNIQLNQGLMRTCAAERSLFCREVQPGSARVFRCLAHNMASTDFGSACRSSLLTKLKRREANWRLDPPLRNACQADVDSLCAEADESLSQDGSVKRCMVENADSLSPGCRRELGRSVYMAFFVWQPNGVVTAPCDADIKRLCLSQVLEMAVMPGAVQLCLSDIVDQMSEAHSMQTLRRLMGQADGIKSLHSPRAQPQQQAAAAAALPSSNSTARHLPRLSEQCYQLAALAHLPKAERSPDFAAAAVSMLSVPLSRAQDATGLQMLQQDHRTGQLAVSLTGWTALAGMTALVVLLLTVATWVVRQYTSPSKDGYSLVQKKAPLSFV